MSKGNMYKFVNKTHNILGGECLHKCTYCYVNSMKQRFEHIKNKYSGDYKIVEKELSKKFKANEIVFACDCNDLFQKDVPFSYINEILEFYKKFPETNFIFQTKNPDRVIFNTSKLPLKSTIITTIESNRDYPEIYKGEVPKVIDRIKGISQFSLIKTQITIEPILDFDLEIFVTMLKRANVNQINIGANTSKLKLTEPTKEKVLQLIKELELFTSVHLKSNLNRLLV